MNKNLCVVSLGFTCALLYGIDNKNIKISDVEIINSGYDETSLKNFLESGSYYYLDKEKITRFRGSSVGDFLSGVPGVLVGNKRNSGSVSVNIRGQANENRVLVSIDDSFEAIPSWQGYSGSSTRTFLDPDLISKVEIEKGSSFKSDAGGATAGIVRINTLLVNDILNGDKDWGFRFTLGSMSNTVKKPPLYTRGGYRVKFIAECIDDHKGDDDYAFYLCKKQPYEPDSRFALNSPFYNFGNSYNSSIAFAKKWEFGDIILAYAKKIQGNYFTGKYGPIPKIDKINYSDEEYLTVLPETDNKEEKYAHAKLGELVFHNKVGYTTFRAKEEILNTSLNNHSYLAKINLGKDDSLFNFSYRGYRSKFGELMPSLYSFRGDGALQGEGSEIKVDSFSAGYVYNPNNPYVNLKLNAYFTKSDSSNFTPFFEDHGYTDSRNAYFTVSNQKGLSISNTSKIEHDDHVLTLNYGVSNYIEKIYPPSDSQKRVESKKYPKDAIAPLYIRNARKDENSAFLWSRYSYGNSLDFDLGFRYLSSEIIDHQPLISDEIDNKTGKQIIIKKYTPNVINHSFAPSAMLTLKFSDAISLYTKYTRATRNPSLFQASRGFSQQSANEVLSLLKPERQINLELGANLLFDGFIRDEGYFGFKFAFFDNLAKDYLTRTFSKTSTIAQTTNIKSALFKGIESLAYFDIKSFYAQLSLTKYLQTRFCLYDNQLRVGTVQNCFSGGINDSNINNTLPPETTLFLTFGTRLFDEKLDLGARYSYYGKRIVSILSPDSNGGFSGVSTHSEEWAPYNLLDLYANYKLDKNLNISMAVDNLTDRYYLDTNNQGLIPAPGRTFRLNLDYKF